MSPLPNADVSVVVGTDISAAEGADEEAVDVMATFLTLAGVEQKSSLAAVEQSARVATTFRINEG